MTKAQRLTRMKALATGLLVLAAGLYGLAMVMQQRAPAWAGVWTAVAAFAEAAMIGAMADWFAVVALFRHPLGLPIPHTAIVASRKDRIGTALGNFVQRNFLQREIVAQKIAAMKLGERAARWLAEPENSRRLARHVATGLSGAVNVLKDDDVQAVYHNLK